VGLPYVLSSDLVSAYPAKSLSIAEYVDGQIPLLAMTQNAQTGVSYSFVLTDFTKLVTISNAGAVAVTLPLESSVAWPAGTQLRILNIGAGTVTVAGAAGVTINGTPLTLAQFKAATLVKTGTNTWSFLPFSSGVGAAEFSDAATGTYTSFKYKTFSASGTLTVTKAGFADIVVIGGGAQGGNGATGVGAGGGGGAGASIALTNAYLPVGTWTVKVGGAGAPSVVATYASPSGGLGGSLRAGWPVANVGADGGSGGGGGGGGAYAGGTGLGPYGFDGGTTSGATGGASGGGGASAVGANSASSVNGGNGGAGTTTSIAGTTPTGAYVAGSYAYGGGGGGGAYSVGTAGTASSGGGAGGAVSNGVAGTANTGGGGGGGAAGNATQNTGALGGSGLVIVRVAV